MSAGTRVYRPASTPCTLQAPEEKGMQVVEDSQPVPLTNDVGLPGDEIDSLGSVLLCILRK